MRIPWRSVALEAHDDPEVLADPEVAFWLALGRSGRKDGGSVRGAIGTLGIAYHIGHGREGLEKCLSVHFTPGDPLCWAARGPSRPVLHALYRLLAAWPSGRWRLRTGHWDAQAVVEVEPVPELLGRSLSAGDEPAVAATALWHVLGGMDPQAAIREAHARPIRDFPGGRANGEILAVDWRIGMLRLPADLAWMDGTVLGDLYRREALLDGFRLELASEDIGRQLRRWDFSSREPVQSVQGRCWLPIMWVNAHWPYWSLGEAAPTVQVWASRVLRKDMRPSRNAIEAAVRAWPAGEKVLLLERQALWSPGLVAGNFAVAAIRLGDAEPETVLRVLELAAAKIAEGVPEEKVCRWLAGLTPRDWEGGAALAHLARCAPGGYSRSKP